MTYPNVEPIRTILLELGFEYKSDYPGYYVRMMGGQPLYLYLWEEYQCWDGDDTTHLQYRFEAPEGALAAARTVWRHLDVRKDDGSYLYLAQKNVPSRGAVKAAIDKLIASEQAEAEKELRAAHTKYTARASMRW